MHQGSRSRGRAHKLDHCKHYYDARDRRQMRTSIISDDSDYYNDCSMKENFFADELGQSVSRKTSLDTTPPQIINSQRKNSSSCLPAVYSQRNYFSHEQFSWKRPEDKHFVDVHGRALRVEKNKEHLTKKKMAGFNKSAMDMYFTSKKFLDCLSSEETFQHSKNELLEYFLDTNSLFRKHVEDMQPYSAAKSRRFEVSRRRRKSLRTAHLQNEIVNSSEKPVTRITDHILEKHRQCIPYKWSALHHQGREESRVQPGLIVLLKPNLSKPKNMAENCHLGIRENRNFAVSRMEEFCKEEMISDDGCNAKRSLEIAMEITRHLRRKASKSSNNAVTSEFKVCSRNDRPCVMTELDRHCQFHGSGTTLSSNRRDLSERWKIKHEYKEKRLVAKGSRTPDELLALPDRKPLRNFVESSNYKKVASRKFVADEVLRMLDNLSSKSSNRRRANPKRNCDRLDDLLHMGSNDLHDSNFATWGSLPLVRGSRHVSNKHGLTHKVGEKNNLPEREIQSHSEGQSKSINVRCISEEQPLLPDLIVGERDAQIPTCQDEKETKNALKMATEIEEPSGTDQRPLFTEEPRTHHPVDFSFQSDTDDDQVHKLTLKDMEQLSPVSVLEPPSEEESSSSGCFERISSNLRELRRQLKVLKLESRGTDGEEISSDDEYGDGFTVMSTVNMLQVFGNEDDRDFAYLQDMLTESGIRNAKLERLSECCHSADNPVSPLVFEKLEKKYGHIVFWLRCERKLLFDLTNSILAGVIGPSIGLRPWVSSRGLISAWNQDRLPEIIWKMVANQRKDRGRNPDDKLLETKWFCLEDSIEEAGSELAGMLTDDLLEELITEFVVG